MKLQQATMQLSMTKNGVQVEVNKLVMLWKEVGLCVHKSIYPANGSGWVISHFNSGKIILRNIKTRQEAEEAMKGLVEVLVDWTFTLEEWGNIGEIDKKLMKGEIDTLQKEILNKG